LHHSINDKITAINKTQVGTG